MAVLDDALSLLLIAVFYPDPDSPFKPKYLIYVAVGMFLAFCLRKWHFRKRRVEHQVFAFRSLFRSLHQQIQI